MGGTGTGHGMYVDGRSSHPLLGTWHMMLTRCYDPKHVGYPYYGGRGISVCTRWRDDFWAFVTDVGERPEGCTLDRIDPDGNYEPSNVRWATRSEQRANRRPARRRTHCLRGGHELTEANTYVRPDGDRMCKTCAAAREARYRQNREGANA